MCAPFGRYVEAYLASDVALELGLQRHDLVSLAMLLGSDYTTGVKGIGIVNAMEVLEAFPNKHRPPAGPGGPGRGGSAEADWLGGLREFRDWHAAWDPVREALQGAAKQEEKREAAKRRKDSAAKRRGKKRRAVRGGKGGGSGPLDEDGEEPDRDTDDEKIEVQDAGAGEQGVVAPSCAAAVAAASINESSDGSASRSHFDRKHRNARFAQVYPLPAWIPLIPSLAAPLSF